VATSNAKVTNIPWTEINHKQQEPSRQELSVPSRGTMYVMIPQRGSADRGRLLYIAEATINQNTPCSTRLRKVMDKTKLCRSARARAYSRRLGEPRFSGMSYHVFLAVVSSTRSKSVYLADSALVSNQQSLAWSYFCQAFGNFHRGLVLFLPGF
jgi:hypothetical protein